MVVEVLEALVYNISNWRNEGGGELWRRESGGMMNGWRRERGRMGGEDKKYQYITMYVWL